MKAWRAGKTSVLAARTLKPLHFPHPSHTPYLALKMDGFVIFAPLAKSRFWKRDKETAKVRQRDNTQKVRRKDRQGHKERREEPETSVKRQTAGD